MKPRVLVIIGIALLVVCGGGGWFVFNNAQTAMRAMRAAADKDIVALERGDLLIQVVETGALSASTSVEVKSRVGGRVAKLFVDEGDVVQAGDLIAIIDPQETELQVRRDRAQLAGAQAGVSRLNVEIDQRRRTSQTQLERARSRVTQLEAELEAQPNLTRLQIENAQAALDSAGQQLEQLVNVSQPNERTALERQLADAEANKRNADAELNRRRSLHERGFISLRELESAELNATLAQTSLESVQAQLDRLEAGQALAREQAEARVAQAETDLERSQVSAFQDVTKQEQYEQALADLKDAETALRDVEALIASRAQSQATVAQTQVSLDDSQRLLGETQVRAPISGIVTRRLIQEGELVTSLGSFSSGTAIVRIDDRSGMEVTLSVNEIDVARLEIGMEAEIEVDAFPDESFTGFVNKIAPSSVGSDNPAASATATDPVVRYIVEVVVNEAPDTLRAGMSARCTMKVLEKNDVLRLPIEYATEEDDGTWTVLIPSAEPAAPGKKGPEPEKRTIEVGVRTGAYIEVLSGLEEGERVKRPEFTGPARQGVIQSGDGGGDEGESEEEKE